MMESDEQDRESRIDQLFLECISLPQSARSTYLEHACGNDRKMRRDVEELLAADQRAETKFDSLLPSQVVKAMQSSVVSAVDNRVGERIGAYRLEQRIARGGFGTVYRAEREKPYRERVAIKLMHLDKVESAELVQRVLREMQVLSDLRHPNIVNQLSSGVTEAGEPYIAMEFVDGIAIDEYCDLHQLSIRDRLDVFRRVCRAVQFAHERGWIHRDLKPGNILVTRDGTPKLLDFGIAKLVRTDSETLHTELTTGPIGTPQYMSPEQFRGESITESSDVYSLGVILFELLTGTRLVSFLLNDNGVTWDEIRRCVCDLEAPKPSQIIAAEKTSAHAENRSTSLVRLKQVLRKDLDNVVLKALRKEPERRYGRAEQLADDLDAWLDHREVSAKPPTTIYRIQKWAQRNRNPTIAAISSCVMALVLVLIFAIPPSLRSSEQATRRRVQEASERLGSQDMANAVTYLCEAYLNCPQHRKSLKRSTLRLLRSWRTYLGHPLMGESGLRIFFNADSSKFMTSEPNGRVRIWTAEGFGSGKSSSVELRTELNVLRAAFSPNDNRLCLADVDRVEIWSLDERTKSTHSIHNIPLHLGFADSEFYVFSADGRTAWSKQLDGNTKEVKRSLSKPISKAKLVGTKYIVGTNNRVELWDRDSLETIKRFPSNIVLGNSIAFDEISNCLFVEHGSSNSLVDIDSYALHPVPMDQALSLDGTGDRILFANNDNSKILEWSKEDGISQQVFQFEPEEQKRIWLDANHLTSDLVATFRVVEHRRTLHVKAREHAFELTRPLALGMPSSLRSSNHPFPYGINSKFAFYSAPQRRFETEPSGRVTVAQKQESGVSGFAWLWEVQPFLQTTTDLELDFIPDGFHTNIDGNRIALWSKDRIQIWNLERGAILHDLAVTGVTCLALNGEGNTLYFGTVKGNVHKVVLAKPSHIVELFDLSSSATSSSTVTQIDVHSQSNTLVAATLEKAHVCKLSEDNHHSTIAATHLPNNTTYKLARFGGDGNLLLSTPGAMVSFGSRSNLRRRNVDLDDPIAIGEHTKQLVGLSLQEGQLSLSVGKATFPIADGNVLCAAFSPKSESFVAGFDNGSVQIWDTETKQPLTLPILCGSAPIKQIHYCNEDLFIVMSELGKFTRVQLPSADTLPRDEELKTEVVTGLGVEMNGLIGERRERLSIEEWKTLCIEFCR